MVKIEYPNLRMFSKVSLRSMHAQQIPGKPWQNPRTTHRSRNSEGISGISIARVRICFQRPSSSRPDPCSVDLGGRETPKF